MKKIFTLFNHEYTVTPCTAIASCDLDAAELLVHDGADRTNSPFRQDALLVETTADSGEKIQKVVFGYQMPESDKDFAEMCGDSSAWESDYEVLDTVWTDPNTNRQIVQEGLDRRAEARAEATQEEQEAIFLEELNKITAANYHTAELIREAQERVREKRKAERKAKYQEEVEATRRDTFMQRIFTALLVIAATILMHNIQAVAFWLALTISITGLLYIIVTIWCYYGIGRKRKKEESHG